jgi:hypothetical protein
VRAFNEAATAVPDWRTPEAADWLREQGMTHIFIGVRGDMMDPAELLQNPGVALVYGRNGAFIFKISATDFTD